MIIFHWEMQQLHSGKFFVPSEYIFLPPSNQLLINVLNLSDLHLLYSFNIWSSGYPFIHLVLSGTVVISVPACYEYYRLSNMDCRGYIPVLVFSSPSLSINAAWFAVHKGTDWASLNILIFCIALQVSWKFHRHFLSLEKLNNAAPSTYVYRSTSETVFAGFLLGTNFLSSDNRGPE